MLGICLSAQVTGSWTPTSLPPVSWAKPLAHPASAVRTPPLSLLDGEAGSKAVRRGPRPSARRSEAVSPNEQPKPAGNAKASNVLGDYLPPAKAKNATQKGHGDVWTYTAIDADSKLAVSWLVGPRSPKSTRAFMLDLSTRLANRVQLTTDGLASYPHAVENAFGWAGADYSQLIKTYGLEAEDSAGRRYSPMVCTGAVKVPYMGRPDTDLISTSYVERSNLTMRMSMRRFTRLTNGFSKKAENHAHAVSLHFMFYNYARPHTTLTKAAKGVKTTPAMATGLTDHVWTVEEILELMNPNRVMLARAS